jgi:hypothetical protein
MSAVGGGGVPAALAAALHGGGLMGARIAAYPWAETSLGPLSEWPPSLCTSVSALLSSRAQIMMFWGPDLLAFFNDAYRTVLGVKEPTALAQPGREVWSEVWDFLHPLLDGVVRTGRAYSGKDVPFWVERHGYVEETYFDISYDPVRAEDASVCGVYCIVTETTGRVLGERRLRTLQELGCWPPTMPTCPSPCCTSTTNWPPRPVSPSARSESPKWWPMRPATVVRRLCPTRP